MVKNSVKKTTRYLSVSLALAVTAGLSGCGGDVATDTDFDAVDVTSPVSDWKMVWSDEFDGTSIDSKKWTHEVNCSGGGNQEQQCYTDAAENSFVSDGTLKIVAMPAEDGADLPYTSARMVTKDKGDWKYGRFEIRAKLPFGQGTWPAFWMLSTDEVYGTWPRSGEIDILEAVNLKEIGPDGMEHSATVGQLYYGSGTPNQDFQFDSSGTTYAMPDGQNPADDFNTYAVEWQEGEIRWYVNDYLFQTQRMSELRTNSSGDVVGLVHRGWYAEFFDIITGQLEDNWDTAPFDQDFHILLNLAIGGAFPANTNNAANFPDTNGIDPAALANGQTFEIDYVRVFECSVDTLTGKGCETTRAGYQTLNSEDAPNGALIEGVAPTPPPPPGGPAIPLTVFGDAVNPAWPLWDSSENTVPMTIMDDDRGEVAQFMVVDNAGAVLGFNTRITDNPTAYNGNGMLAAGNFSFDMKVISAPSGGDTPWILKVESDGNSSNTGDIPLTSSIEGQAPVTGQWQTYTFSVKSLSDAGLELGLIDLIMIFPTWGTGEGAEYLVDNVKFSADGVASPELLLFADDTLPGWPLWDCCAGSVPSIETDDAEHGSVIEFDVLGNAETVQGFFGRGGPDLEADPFDASALGSSGVVQFEMKIVTGASSGTVPWIFKLEADGNTSDTGDIDLSTSNEGLAPVEGVWQTYTFNLSDLAASGLDISAIDVVMIFPAWGQGGGAVYRVDNVRIYNPDGGTGGGGGGTATVTETLYDDALGTDLAFNFFDNGEGTIAYSEEMVDGRGTVVQVVKSGATGNFYFEGGFDLTPWQAQGELVFDLNVVSTDADVTMLVKFDSGWPNVSDVSINLPAVGEWTEVRLSVAEILSNNNSIDPSGIADPANITNIFVVEPSGVVTFQLDNVRIEIPGSDPVDPVDPPSAATTIFFDDALATGLNYNFFDYGAGTLAFGEQDEDSRGKVIEVAKSGPDGNFYFESAGTDMSGYVATGELVFDLNIVSSDDGVSMLVKFDSGWPNVSDYVVPLPAVGEWGEIRIAVADIFANPNSFDPSGTADPTSVINVFVVEPNGVMTFKLDNVRIEN
jgi:beta-glucanase (GH16 family)